MSFIKRQLSVSFQLQAGASNATTQFAESGTNTAALSNLRMSAKIVKSADPTLNTCNLTIYGMTLSLMNQLSTLGMQVNLKRPALVTVQAGDAVNGLNTVFQGNVAHAWADFHSAPDVPFHVEAYGGLVGSVQPMKPSSFQGSTDVATFMGQCAQQMNLTLENNGVSQKLNNPYFWGSPMSQARQCADAANIGFSADDDKLAIWPKDKPRSGGTITVSPATGMISYPTFTNAGIMVRTLFTPQIKLRSQIQVQSSLPRANGQWIVWALDYDLESQLPRGQWFMTLQCYNPNQQSQVPVKS